MKKFLTFLILFIFVLLYAQEKPIVYKDKYALVIGVNDYTDKEQLSTLNGIPINDAKDMKKELESIGFDVTLLLNPKTLMEINESIQEFVVKTKKKKGIALVYFSGHGVQAQNESYLLPTDIKIRLESDIKYGAYPVSRLVDSLNETSNPAKIVLLDACRTVVFKGYKSGGKNVGLAKLQGEVEGVFVGYAAVGGAPAIAVSFNNRNSPYTQKVIENIKSPKKIQDIFHDIKNQVYQLTGKQQRPDVNDSLVGNLYLQNPEKLYQEGEFKVNIQTTQREVDVLNSKTNEVIGKSNTEIGLSGKENETIELVLRKEGYDDLSVEILLGKDKTKNYSLKSNKGLSKTFKNSIGMEFVLIPEGEFMMGCEIIEKGIITDTYDKDCYDNEKPAHKVKITNAFYMGKYEVTQAQWKKVMGKNPSYYQGKNCKTTGGCDNHPVESVSWKDVQEYIKKLNEKEEENRRRTSASSPSSFTKYRLPTEAEWEYAARAGTKTQATSLDVAFINDYAWYWDNSYIDNKKENRGTHPVGQKKANAWGLYDMSGNVWEWCEDWYDEKYYEKSVQENPNNQTSASYKLLRGGSWSNDPRYLRVSIRDRFDSNIRFLDLGFRVVLSVQ